MGFEKQLNSIIFDYDLIDKSFRNNFLFSATFNESVIKIIRKFMNDYYFIQICDKEINFIKQEFIFIKNEEKNKKIFELLKKYFNTKIIIFTNTKLNSENLFNLIKNDNNNNFNIDLINGNKNQNERKKTIENFYNNKINILIKNNIYIFIEKKLIFSTFVPDIEHFPYFIILIAIFNFRKFILG